MEIRLNRAEFLNELVPMQGIVERRTTIPVLSHLLLQAGEERLNIAATDLEVSLTSWCPADVVEEGAIAIQAKKLQEIIRASAGDEVTLKIEREGFLTILAGNSRFKIRGMPSEDFPTLTNIEDEEPLRIPFPVFRAMSAKVFFAISSEESRFQLSGALMKLDEGSLSLVATDGHRLALVESVIEGMGESDGILVPRKALQELQRFEGEDLVFRRSEHHLSFTIGRRQLICRVLEGTFPDYERVISKDNELHVLVDREALKDVVRRVSLLTGDRTRAIKMDIEPNQLIFTATNPDLGEAREEVDCEYEGPTLALGVNPDYFSDFLGATETQRIRLEVKDENSQCIAYPVDGIDKRYVCVIMPIRL